MNDREDVNPVKDDTIPMLVPLGSSSASTDQSRVDDHRSLVGAGELSDPTANRSPIPLAVSPSGQPSATTDQPESATQGPLVGGGEPSEPAVHRSHDTHTGPDGWLELRIWAEMFFDAQQQRIASVNRAERGGVDPEIYAPYIESLDAAEKVVRRQMILTYRRAVPEPIRAWVKTTHGLGEPLMARILGHLGHPRWATPHHWEGTGAARVLVTDPPFERSVSQLWAYCGHGRPGRVRKGASAADLAALGSPQLKMLTHVAAECCMKTKTSPFRLVYERARTDYADKVHSVPCVRCGPSGKPAQEGSPWSLGHQHAGALRIVGKEILRDLWRVSA